jgi:hypothetical protein
VDPNNPNAADATLASSRRAIKFTGSRCEIGTSAPGVGGLELQRTVEQGKMKSTIRGGMVSKASCRLGLGGHGSCRSTSIVDKPVGSGMLSGELSRVPVRNFVRSFQC